MMVNLADGSYLGRLDKVLKRRRDQELNDIRAVMANESGRRFVWRLLEKAKVFGSVWHPSALIHYNAGQQDFGHFIMSEITESSEEAFVQMMKENKKDPFEEAILTKSTKEKEQESREENPHD